MSALNKRDPFFLFFGDIIIFFLSLWLTLALRYWQLPARELIALHLTPFIILCIVWLLVLFIAGLYEKRIIILKNKLPATVLKIHLVNSSIAVIFFYFIPIFGITPKTILFIFLFVSYILLVGWRLYAFSLLGPKYKQHAILIGNGHEMKELEEEVNSKNYYLRFVASIDLNTLDINNFQQKIIHHVKQEDVSVVVVDFSNDKVNALLPHLYSLMFSGVVFINLHKVYENVFDRMPLSLIKYSWFMENISLAPKRAYDMLKRSMDIVVATILGIGSLITYPFIIAAIKYEDGGPIFITQDRVGKNGRSIKIYKFRTMNSNDNGIYHEGKTQNYVTKVGDFLRKTRLDELPQFWNVFHGEISFIGPRPEFPPLVHQYEKEIPYYGVRHLIKPGLSGWAQIYHDNHPHHGLGVDQTKEKLAYDLYYLKNRSFVLDVVIALKTIKKMLSRSGI